MTIALAGVNCRELFTILVTFFGKDTGIDPFSFLDAAPKVPVPLDLTDTESEEEVGGDGSSTAEGSEVVSTSTSTAATPAPLQEAVSSSSTHQGALPSSATTSLQLQAQPSSSTSTPLSIPIGISTISSDPQPSSSGFWVSPLPRRSVCVHDKPIRIRWLTSIRLPDAIHQMLILYTTQESPHSMLLGVQGPLDVVLLCTIVLTPISAALLLMLGISQAVGVMSEKCIWESALHALTVQSSYTTMEVDGASTCTQSTPLFPGILPRSKPHLWHPPTL